MTEANTPAKADRGPALVVAGMHRSGTSAMARTLSLAGGALPERVILPGPDNPLGFWEPWEMVALSDEILADVGSSWDDIFVHGAEAPAWARREAFLGRARAFVAHNFAGRPLPVVKDPRASVLTRLWREALAGEGYRPVYVVMARHPLEVAGSLAARDGFPTAKSLLVWAGYMLAAERDTRGEARVFVAYPDLIADWRGVLDRIEAAAGVVLPARETAAAEIDRYLSGSHRHHEAQDEALAALDVLPVIRIVHDWMQAAALGDTPDPAVMDEAARTMDQLKATIGPVLAFDRAGAAAREATLRTGLADAEARLLRARSHGIELEIGLAEAESRARARIGELEKSVAAGKARESKIGELESELRAARLSLTAAQVEVSQAREAIDQARHEAEQARHEAEQTRQVADQARHAADQARQAIDQAHAQIGSAVEVAQENARLAHERMLAIMARDIRIGTLEGELQAVRDRAHALEADVAEHQARVDTLKHRIETMKSGFGWKVARPIRVIEGRMKRAKSPS